MNKKKIIIFISIIVIMLIAILVIVKFTHLERSEVFMDRSEIWNLRAIEPATNKTYAELLINEIPKYESTVKNFALKDNYPPDYILTSVNVIEGQGIREPVTTTSLYTSESTKADIYITILSFKSAKDAQSKWKDFLKEFSSGIVPPSERNGISVGDIAVAMTETDIIFVRGNIFISLCGFSGNSVVEMAKQIDGEIIQAIEESKG